MEAGYTYPSSLPYLCREGWLFRTLSLFLAVFKASRLSHTNQGKMVSQAYKSSKDCCDSRLTYVQRFLSLTFFLAPILAAPLVRPEAGVCVDYCGSVCYYQSDIDAALQKGYSLYQSGQTLGSNDYPHTETNYEGFDFAVPGPYQEFPILNTYKVYTGGSPGADRVVFNTKLVICHLLTNVRSLPFSPQGPVRRLGNAHRREWK